MTNAIPPWIATCWLHDDLMTCRERATGQGRHDVVEAIDRRLEAIQASPLAARVRDVVAFHEQVQGRRASRLRPMVDRHGVVDAVARLVGDPLPSAGYHALTRIGRFDMTFEGVVLAFPEAFDAMTLRKARLRLPAGLRQTV